MAPKKSGKAQARKQIYRKRKSQSKIWLAIVLIAVIVIGVGVYIGVAGNQGPAPIKPTKVIMETNLGNITIDLRTDKPITSTNFINLCKDNRYDNSTFHRVLATFMIQGGITNPADTNMIKDEIGSNNHNTNYTIAMAKTSDPNSATSEFFINTVDNSGTKRYAGFDDTYAVFGTVIEGQSVVNAIAHAEVAANPQIPGETSLPVNPVVILHTYVIPY
jgi:cyclophilin family peptidyl-prolyl cis-trans isomerase